MNSYTASLERTDGEGRSRHTAQAIGTEAEAAGVAVGECVEAVASRPLLVMAHAIGYVAMMESGDLMGGKESQAARRLRDAAREYTASWGQEAEVSGGYRTEPGREDSCETR